MVERTELQLGQKKLCGPSLWYREQNQSRVRRKYEIPRYRRDGREQN